MGKKGKLKRDSKVKCDRNKKDELGETVINFHSYSTQTRAHIKGVCVKALVKVRKHC